METIQIDHERWPALGVGTHKVHMQGGVESLKNALEIGYTLFDTAEGYGNGKFETLLGKVIKNHDREDLLIISKVSPENCSFIGIIKAAKATTARLGTHVDLYLIHSPPKRPIKEVISAMEKVADMGLTRFIGVSNFDPLETRKAVYSAKRYPLVANESKMSLTYPNSKLKEACDDLGLAFIAYSPLDKGELIKDERVVKEAKIQKKTPSQTALRWILDQKALPLVRAADKHHLKENLGALDWKLKNPKGLMDKFLIE